MNMGLFRRIKNLFQKKNNTIQSQSQSIRNGIQKRLAIFGKYTLGIENEYWIQKKNSDIPYYMHRTKKIGSLQFLYNFIQKKAQSLLTSILPSKKIQFVHDSSPCHVEFNSQICSSLDDVIEETLVAHTVLEHIVQSIGGQIAQDPLPSFPAGYTYMLPVRKTNKKYEYYAKAMVHEFQSNSRTCGLHMHLGFGCWEKNALFFVLASEACRLLCEEKGYNALAMSEERRTAFLSIISKREIIRDKEIHPKGFNLALHPQILIDQVTESFFGTVGSRAINTRKYVATLSHRLVTIKHNGRTVELRSFDAIAKVHDIEKPIQALYRILLKVQQLCIKHTHILDHLHTL